MQSGRNGDSGSAVGITSGQRRRLRNRPPWILDLQIVEVEKLAYGGLQAIFVVGVSSGRGRLMNPCKSEVTQTSNSRKLAE